jgi:hypothetical protein
LLVSKKTAQASLPSKGNENEEKLLPHATEDSLMKDLFKNWLYIFIT